MQLRSLLMQRNRLAVVMHDRMGVTAFRRSGKFHLAEKGRWGPRWLHRLVLKAARNLGMIRSEVVGDTSWQTQSYTPIDYDKAISDQIGQAVLEWVNRGWNPRDLEVIGDAKFFGDLMRSTAGHYVEIDDYPIDVSKRFGSADPFVYGQTIRFQGIRARILPHLEGWAIIPRSR
jgi:hypothetical protein